VALCEYHHRAVHDRGWQIAGSATGPLEFVKPSGRIANETPDPDVRGEVERLADSFADDRIDERTTPPRPGNASTSTGPLAASATPSTSVAASTRTPAGARATPNRARPAPTRNGHAPSARRAAAHA